MKCESRKQTCTAWCEPRDLLAQGEREGREARVEANAAGQKSTTYNPLGGVRAEERQKEATISLLMTVSDKLQPDVDERVRGVRALA